MFLQELGFGLATFRCFASFECLLLLFGNMVKTAVALMHLKLFISMVYKAESYLVYEAPSILTYMSLHLQLLLRHAPLAIQLETDKSHTVMN